MESKEKYLPNKSKIEYYKNNPATHELRHHGWTNQTSRCGYAVWWDCYFWCSNPKLNPKNILCPSCRVDPNGMREPDFEKCKKMRRKLT